MTLRIYNTLTRQMATFTPIQPKHVRMYVCGMTIYDLCHIGHARMMMAFDVAQRWLKAQGYAVTYVRNITDIDDKIIARAVARGISIRELTDEMTDAMHKDIAALYIEPPTIEPRATDFIGQMIGLIQTLEQKGLAYVDGSGDVNFAVRRFAHYGKLSGKSIDELQIGMGLQERSGNDNADAKITSTKTDPLDFALWKAAKPHEPLDAQWQSPYGSGRPGWHIECSAMACATLGETFDIHGGGADLQFPHHDNEIAQSEGAHGVPLANIWMHNGFVRVDNEKMSKSLGNFFTIREVLEQFDAETVRFFIVRTHYRSPLNYSQVHLEDARQALKRLYTALLPFALSLDENTNTNTKIAPNLTPNPTVDALLIEQKSIAHEKRFAKGMNEDFGTPEAIAVLFDVAAELNVTKNPQLARCLKKLGGYLGLLQQNPQTFLQTQNGTNPHIDTNWVQEQIHARDVAKKNKDFATSDAIRNNLLTIGVVLKDTTQGTQWEFA